MAMLIVAYGSGRLAWSKGRRPLALFLHSSRETGELSQCAKYDDSTINIVQVLLIYYYYYQSFVGAVENRRRITHHTVDTCPITNFDGGLLMLIREADDYANKSLTTRPIRRQNLSQNEMNAI